jgi:hypothetical protein
VLFLDITEKHGHNYDRLVALSQFEEKGLLSWSSARPLKPQAGHDCT